MNHFSFKFSNTIHLEESKETQQKLISDVLCSIPTETMNGDEIANPSNYVWQVIGVR